MHNTRGVEMNEPGEGLREDVYGLVEVQTVPVRHGRRRHELGQGRTLDVLHDQDRLPFHPTGTEELDQVLVTRQARPDPAFALDQELGPSLRAHGAASRRAAPAIEHPQGPLHRNMAHQPRLVVHVQGRDHNAERAAVGCARDGVILGLPWGVGGGLEVQHGASSGRWVRGWIPRGGGGQGPRVQGTKPRRRSAASMISISRSDSVLARG